TACMRARDEKGVSVIISERACNTFLTRITGKTPSVPYEVDHSRCQVCAREQTGERCNVEPSKAYARQRARSRAMDKRENSCFSVVAPCSAQCPLSVCIPGFVGNIAAGEYKAAFQHILSKISLPETVCRVCHRPCEAVCEREAFDESIAINDLKRWVIDWAAKQESPPYKPEMEPNNGLRVAVIGAGPSGLAAAHDLRLRGYAVTIFDANDEPGGLLLTGIPEFRLPREALHRDVARILSLGVEFHGKVVLGQDLQIKNLLEKGFDAVYLAVGAHQALGLALEGEDAPGRPVVIDALAYLKTARLSGKEGTPDAGKRVVVVGGGNAAIDAARTARRYGAEKVVVVYRRRKKEMPAIPSEVLAAEEEGIELRTQLQPVRILRGEKTGLECVRTEPGPPDDSGRKRPIPIEGTEVFLEADSIVAAIGQSPQEDLFDSQEPSLEYSDDGAIRIDPLTGQTSHLRIFAGGDLVSQERTVTWAMASGKRAAWGIDRKLRGEVKAAKRLPPPIPEEPPANISYGQPDERTERYDFVARQHPSELSLSERVSDFKEVVSVFSKEQARGEAFRCLICGLCANCRSCLDLFGCPAFYTKEGRIHIDPNICTGCGVCADLCPNGAIRLKQEDACV
ncbi:MAG: FAD-dependent oxidoreductase, partial [Pseudomonadota bacterium]